jgi:hypothetical protein
LGQCSSIKLAGKGWGSFFLGFDIPKVLASPIFPRGGLTEGNKWLLHVIDRKRACSYHVFLEAGVGVTHEQGLKVTENSKMVMINMKCDIIQKNETWLILYYMNTNRKVINTQECRNSNGIRENNGKNVLKVMWNMTT